MFSLFQEKVSNNWTPREEESIQRAVLLNLKNEEYLAQHVVLAVLNHYPLLNKRGAKNVRDQVIDMIRKNKPK